MEKIIKYTKILDMPGKYVGLAAAWLVVPMVVVLVYDVVSRYAFDRPIIWTYDITYMLYGSIFLLGAAYALGRDKHVRADFLYNTLSPRWQGIIDLLFYLFLFFPSIGTYTWLTAHFAAHSWAIGETIPTSPWMPIIYPYKTVMPVCGILLLIQGISEVLKNIYSISTNRRFRNS